MWRYAQLICQKRGVQAQTAGPTSEGTERELMRKKVQCERGGIMRTKLQTRISVQCAKETVHGDSDAKKLVQKGARAESMSEGL
jgi:hypothetical protein